MSRHKEEAAAGRGAAQNESAARSGAVGFPRVDRWLPAPRRRPIILGVLAALYLAWLLALAGMAVRVS